MGAAAAAGAYHLCDAPVGEDVACVDEAVQHLRRLLDQVALVGVVLQLLVCRGKQTEKLWWRLLHLLDHLQGCTVTVSSRPCSN